MLKRAALYLRRKYRRTILLLLLLFVISFSLAIGLTVWNSIGAVTCGIRQELGTSFVMRVPSHVIYGTDSNYTEVVDENGQTKRQYTGFTLDEATVEQIMQQVEGLDTYNAEKSEYVHADDFSLLYGKFANAWENWNETGGDPAERIGWKILSEEAMLYGNTDSALYDKFRTGAFELVAGRHIAPEDRKKVLISEQLAEQNQLGLGDTITLSARAGMAGLPDTYALWGEAQEMEIVGIFHINGDQPAGALVSENDQTYNWLICDLETACYFQYVADLYWYTDRMIAPQYDNVTFFVDDPAQLDTVMDELETLDGLNILDYEVAVDDTMYRTTVDPLLSIRNLVAVVVAAVAAGCFVVLCIIFTMWVRSRRREVAIYLSLGFRKGKIIGQFVLEAAAVALAALILTAAVCGPVAGRIGNGLLSSAVEAAQPEEQQFSEDELWQAALAGETLYHYDSGSYAGPEQIDFTFGLVEVLLLAALELLIITAAVCKGGSFIFTMQPRQIMTTLS